MYGQYVREMPDTVEKKESWTRLRTGDLKVETEALICATQEQALTLNTTLISQSNPLYVDSVVNTLKVSPTAHCVFSTLPL